MTGEGSQESRTELKEPHKNEEGSRNCLNCDIPFPTLLGNSWNIALEPILTKQGVDGEGARTNTPEQVNEHRDSIDQE